MHWLILGYAVIAAIYFSVAMGYISAVGLKLEDGSTPSRWHWIILAVAGAICAAVWPISLYLGLSQESTKS